MRKGRKWVPPAALAALVWGGFFIHACSSGPVFDDPAGIGDIAAAPRIQVALTAAMRVETASFAVHGAFAISTANGVAASGERLQARAWVDDAGIHVNDRTFREPSVRVSCARDGDLDVGGVRYHGDLLLVADQDRQTRAPRLTLVNDVDLERYLMGVVGKEMHLSEGVEALKAQVIAARTYAMYEARNRTLRTVKGEKFDLYDDERSQVYGGMQRETDLARRLVQETRGYFVTWNGRIVKTFFSSTCGGSTEPARMVLGGEAEDIPPLGGTTCPYCENSRHFRWTESFLKTEVARKLFPDRPQAKVRSVRISKTLPRGHASEVRVVLEGSTREIVLEANAEFRRRIDSRRIKSTLWDKVDDSGDRIVITGRGWGHGAGLCQVGAYRMADLGKDASEILVHYYPTAEIRKLY